MKKGIKITCQGTCFAGTLSETMMRVAGSIGAHIRRYETSGRPVFITVVGHRRIPYLKNLVSYFRCTWR